MNIILLGAPGAGKGTIAKNIQAKYNIPHVSTGDIFRENIKNGTELGKLAKSYMDKGALVPDEVTINMMIDKLSGDGCKNGYILDGFPRTIPQADGLDAALLKDNKKIDLVLLVETPDDLLIERMSGRRVCEKCGATYNVNTLPPKKEGICDLCGSNLIIRKDDTKEVMMDRLKTYHEQTQPLIEYYKKKGILNTISGLISTEAERINAIELLLKDIV